MFILLCYFQRDVEVFCSPCAITTCSDCHLTHHDNHEHTILEELVYNLRKKFSSKILNLKYAQYNVVLIFLTKG